MGRVAQIALERILVGDRRVDGEVIGDRPIADVPGALPELQLGDLLTELLEGLRAG